jgi:hypothetical protein
MKLLREITTLASGQSYWHARLSSGRVVRELEFFTDILAGRMRHMEWLEDVIASGDLAKVVEVTLYTPQGDVSIPVIRPYGAFQLNQGIAALFTGERIKTAQIVGSITSDEGDCVAAIWDARQGRLYPEMHTNLFNFCSWHPDVPALGRLNVEALGVRL